MLADLSADLNLLRIDLPADLPSDLATELPAELPAENIIHKGFNWGQETTEKSAGNTFPAEICVFLVVPHSPKLQIKN